jgi:hypothetical protein
MSSFAKFRNNESYQQAARALGTTVKKAAQTKAGRQEVKAYARSPQTGYAPSQEAPTLEQQVSNTTPSGGQSYSFASIPGQYVNMGIQGLVDYGNKFKDNETVQGIVGGKIGDVYGTAANTGLAIAYNDAFLGSLGTYQKGLEDLKTGNTLKLMGAEGAITSDLYGKQGDEQRKTVETQGQQSRLLTQTQGEQERLNLQETGNQTLRLRADARGAVRSQGARFYG